MGVITIINQQTCHCDAPSISPINLPSPYLGRYPLVNKQFAIENGPVEIVDFPMKNGWVFHSYVNVYQRVFTIHMFCLKFWWHKNHMDSWIFLKPIFFHPFPDFWYIKTKISTTWVPWAMAGPGPRTARHRINVLGPSSVPGAAAPVSPSTAAWAAGAAATSAATWSLGGAGVERDLFERKT